MAEKYRNLHWERDQFTVSTDPTLLSIPSINAALSNDYIYWAKPLPEPDMQVLIDSSLCFGVYEQPTPGGGGERQQIGFGRVITDYTTFAYLTDVYILPDYQGTGLGKWLIGCMREWIRKLPHLRMAMLFTGNEKAVKFYERNLQMKAIGTSFNTMGWKGPGDVIDW
ncbi:MAG: hypothetical protein Q9227_005402 [Pyrenula ochraceoflavens]